MHKDVKGAVWAIFGVVGIAFTVASLIIFMYLAVSTKLSIMGGSMDFDLWISTGSVTPTGRLPEYDKEVLLLIAGGTIRVGKLMHTGEHLAEASAVEVRFVDPDNTERVWPVATVLAWRPLPPRPAVFASKEGK